jgi:hypothetical protein
MLELARKSDISIRIEGKHHTLDFSIQEKSKKAP